MMSADASELRELAHDLGTVGPTVARKVEGVVKRGALNVKNTMREDFQQSRHFAQIGRTINYDVNDTPTGIEAEIGPNKYWRAARLANIAYFGSSRGGGGTVDVDNGLRKEQSAFLENLRKVAGDVL